MQWYRMAAWLCWPAVTVCGADESSVSITRLPKFILEDQKAIWTSPFHIRKPDAKWWAIFGGATLGLIAADEHIMGQVPQSGDALAAGRWGSRLGAVYTVLPVSAGFYFLGSATHRPRLRETGLLAMEALAGSTVVGTVLKAATFRERPFEGDGEGRFWHGSGRLWNGGSSFPSGHAIDSWALASVVAHEYPRPRIVPVLVYGLAGTVAAVRIASQKHFPSDVVAGSAMGWFIGDFIYRRRHSRDLDQRPAGIGEILSRVRVGVAAHP